MTENFDQIKMEIHSCFVRKHKYWENRGKNWIPRITGLDERYGYKREFLETTSVGREKVFLLEDFRVGDIYEIASMHSRGGSTHVGFRDTFVCTEITETHVVLECISQEEVLERCDDQEKVAVNLVQQLLKIVTKDEAVELIQVYG
jgi:hypothetical protein